MALACGVAAMLLLSLGKPQEGSGSAQSQWHGLGNLLVFGADAVLSNEKNNILP